MIQQIDFTILDWIQANLKCPFMDFIMPLITLLGQYGIVWIILSIVFLCTKRYRRCGFETAVGLLSSLLIGNLIIKNLICRDRPCWINEGVELLIKMPTDYSFPSGHTLICMIPATILMFENKKFGIPAMIITVLVAFSRLYLYVHFPTDVLGSIIIGLVIGIAVHMIIKNVKWKWLS